MNPKKAAKKLFFSLYHYLCFFLLMAFLITCCMLLFLSILSKSMNIVLTEEMINSAAILTFWNVVFLSFLCTVIDAVRRKITVDRPVQTIVSAAKRLAKGDYTVRIPALKILYRANELDKIVDCFNTMAEELSGIETLQTDFISNVSHELKTPLAVMQNYATLLQDASLTQEERTHYAKTIADACRRLSDLVTNILKLNKLENQQIYPSAKRYELNEQLCECLLQFESIWEEKKIEIETDLSESILVYADPELLSLVWNNLISNALKFTSSYGKVSVSLKKEGGNAVVRVSDTGCGITPEIGRHIFEKFYQGDSSHAEQGNGLGLALVKRVIDILQGEISVKSIPDQGSVFTVSIRCTE